MASAFWSMVSRLRDRQLRTPGHGHGQQWANGSTLEFANGAADDRVALIEKAYAELNAQTNAPHGMELNSASDSYEGIAAGYASALPS